MHDVVWPIYSSRKTFVVHVHLPTYLPSSITMMCQLVV
jgi:hypothetical protein